MAMPTTSHSVTTIASMPIVRHPGKVIRDLWMDGITSSAAARELDVPPGVLRDLLEGRASITPALARKMEAAEWSTFSFWMRLQANYEHNREQADRTPTDGLPGGRSTPAPPAPEPEASVIGK